MRSSGTPSPIRRCRMTGKDLGVHIYALASRYLTAFSAFAREHSLRCSRWRSPGRFISSLRSTRSESARISLTENAPDREFSCLFLARTRAFYMCAPRYVAHSFVSELHTFNVPRQFYRAMSAKRDSCRRRERQFLWYVMFILTYAGISRN